MTTTMTALLLLLLMAQLLLPVFSAETSARTGTTAPRSTTRTTRRLLRSDNDDDDDVEDRRRRRDVVQDQEGNDNDNDNQDQEGNDNDNDNDVDSVGGGLLLVPLNVRDQCRFATEALYESNPQLLEAYRELFENLDSPNNASPIRRNDCAIAAPLAVNEGNHNGGGGNEYGREGEEGESANALAVTCAMDYRTHPAFEKFRSACLQSEAAGGDFRVSSNEVGVTCQFQHDQSAIALRMENVPACLATTTSTSNSAAPVVAQQDEGTDNDNIKKKLYPHQQLRQGFLDERDIVGQGGGVDESGKDYGNNDSDDIDNNDCYGDEWDDNSHGVGGDYSGPSYCADEDFDSAFLQIGRAVESSFLATFGDGVSCAFTTATTTTTVSASISSSPSPSPSDPVEGDGGDPHQDDEEASDDESGSATPGEADVPEDSDDGGGQPVAVTASEPPARDDESSYGVGTESGDAGSAGSGGIESGGADADSGTGTESGSGGTEGTAAAGRNGENPPVVATVPGSETTASSSSSGSAASVVTAVVSILFCGSVALAAAGLLL